MWKEFLASYGKRAIGAAAGLFLGIIYLFAGFWDMLMVGLLISAGYWVGKQREQQLSPFIPFVRLWHFLLNKIRLYK